MLVDQRQTVRKIVRSKAVVVMDGMQPQQGRTIDLSTNGVSITFDHKLAPGHMGAVMFELFVDGKGLVLNCRARVSHCIFSGDQFKIGFQFINLDVTNAATINKFLR